MKTIVLFIPPLLVIGRTKEWPAATKGAGFTLEHPAVIQRMQVSGPDGVPQNALGLAGLGARLNFPHSNWISRPPERDEESAFVEFSAGSAGISIPRPRMPAGHLIGMPGGQDPLIK